jgi:F-type H+-transporting ATPase subunit a
MPIEVLGIFTKPFSLLIRLFANISAGHVIIMSLIALIVMVVVKTISVWVTFLI